MSRRRFRRPPGDERAQPDLVAPGRRGAGRGRRLHRRPVDPPAPEATADPTEDDDTEDDDPSYVLPSAVLDRIAAFIAETPAERAARLRVEREAAFISAGETKSEREARHRAERKAAERSATALWRQQHGERVKRFRQWVLLTAVSTGVGWEIGLPQLLAHLPMPIQVGTAFGAWSLDWELRGRGRVRVSSVRGKGRILLLIVTRVPVASALVALLGLVPTIAVLYGHVPAR